MFKKKEEEQAARDLPETKTAHPNPNSDPVCAGCDKPINTITVKEDGRFFHNQYCFNEFKLK